VTTGPIALLEREPSLFHLGELNALLLRAVEHKVSDVVLKPGDPVWLSLHGEWVPGTRRSLVAPEISQLLNETARHPSASAQVAAGSAMDYAYEAPVDRLTRNRFRVNATQCRTSRGSGIELTLRSIPGIPPSLSDMNFEPGILANLFPLYGLVLSTGPVGSGKTTGQASALAHLSRTRRRRILTYEAPVEFDLDGIPDRIAPVTQMEIPNDLREFKDTVRNSLRRAGNILLVGECRDAETFRSLFEASETGVAVYSTAHTNSVADTISRTANMFPWQERDGTVRAMIAALRLVIHQRLFPSPAGGRVAVREYLAFTPEIRKSLLKEDYARIVPRIEELVERDGMPLWRDAKAKADRGLISEETCEEILLTTGSGISGPGSSPGPAHSCDCCFCTVGGGKDGEGRDVA
jgi:defect-in-organelle-trafficking protein DotB